MVNPNWSSSWWFVEQPIQKGILKKLTGRNVCFSHFFPFSGLPQNHLQVIRNGSVSDSNRRKWQKKWQLILFREPAKKTHLRNGVLPAVDLEMASCGWKNILPETNIDHLWTATGHESSSNYIENLRGKSASFREGIVHYFRPTLSFL